MMSDHLSDNTQAILLLTAPLLMASKSSVGAPLLEPRQYQRLARRLMDLDRQPADFLSARADEVIQACSDVVDADQLRALLQRGFLLSQAVERWRARCIWVVSRADAAYPRCLKSKMKERAPAILYGCGDIEILTTGGLAVVGSRKIDGTVSDYARSIGALAAKANQTVVSGGAKGVDRAAMDGALGEGGRVAEIIAEELERAAMKRKNRDALRSGKLVLVSEYDPRARFSVGHAMQRNKLIYAFADYALVVAAERERGGTWAGAVEQLDRFHFVPVFVRSTGEPSEGLDALRDKGAIPWPNPSEPSSMVQCLCEAAEGGVGERDEPRSVGAADIGPAPVPGASPAAELFQKVQDLVLAVLSEPMGEAEVAALLLVTKAQAHEWLSRMCDAGLIERNEQPLRYRSRQ